MGAPPESIGKFGGDTDNWMWPRHTGDFALFRVYTAPDGSPAEYHEDNIPLKPKHHLPISLDGVEQDAWSGEVDWTLASYPVSSGEHTFRWSYTKDSSPLLPLIVIISLLIFTSTPSGKITGCFPILDIYNLF